MAPQADGNAGLIESSRNRMMLVCLKMQDALMLGSNFSAPTAATTFAGSPAIDALNVDWSLIALSCARREFLGKTER